MQASFVYSEGKNPLDTEFVMTVPIVFIDIAGPDDTVLKTFYFSVFGWQTDQVGKFSVSVDSPIHGAIRKDPAEQRLYLGVPDITATLSLVEQFGGTVEASRFEVSNVVVLGLFQDPAGNKMGLVELDGNKPRVPKGDSA